MALQAGGYNSGQCQGKALKNGCKLRVSGCVWLITITKEIVKSM